MITALKALLIILRKKKCFFLYDIINIQANRKKKLNNGIKKKLHVDITAIKKYNNNYQIIKIETKLGMIFYKEFFI